MSLQPLLEASWVIQVHTFCAIAAFVLGLVQIFAPKGTLPHKTLGLVWVGLMVVISATSIFIRPSVYGYDLPFLQWFTWIHLFIIVTMIGVTQGVVSLMRGGAKLKGHAWHFISIYIGAIVIAGAFTFLPGRIMHQVVFGAG